MEQVAGDFFYFLHRSYPYMLGGCAIGFGVGKLVVFSLTAELMHSLERLAEEESRLKTDLATYEHRAVVLAIEQEVLEQKKSIGFLDKQEVKQVEGVVAERGELDQAIKDETKLLGEVQTEKNKLEQKKNSTGWWGKALSIGIPIGIWIGKAAFDAVFTGREEGHKEK